MKPISLILTTVLVMLFFHSSKAQGTIDMVRFSFGDWMKLRPKYRTIDITINRNDSIPTIRVEIDKSSMNDIIQAELKAREILKTSEDNDDVLEVRRKIGQLYRSDTTFAISVSQLDLIENMLLSLDEEQLKKSLDTVDGCDGTTSYLIFKKRGKYVRFDIWSADYQTKKRGLGELLKAINQILTTGLIKPKHVWN